MVAFQAPGRAAWSARDSATLTRVGFLGNPVAFRCVKIVAEAAAAVPVVVQDADRRFDVHPVIELLAAPNPGQGGAALMESFYGHLLLTGDGYLEAAGVGAGGGPRELYVLRSDRMKVVPGADGWPVAYEYSVGRAKHVFDMRQDRVPVLHVKSFHPQDDHYGLSPLNAAASAIDVHNSASTWSKALLDNAARPSGAIVYKGADGQGALGGRPVRAAGRGARERTTRGRATPGGRCCSRAGSTGSRWGSRRATWSFTAPRRRRRATWRWPSGCRRCCSGCRATTPMRTTPEAHRAFYRLTVLPLVAKTLAAMSGWLPAFYGARVPAQGRLRQRAGAGRGARGALAADQRGAAFLSDAREAAAARAAEVPRRMMRGTGVRGGGSRFLYEPFDAAAARIEVNERIAGGALAAARAAARRRSR